MRFSNIYVTGLLVLVAQFSTPMAVAGPQPGCDQGHAYRANWQQKHRAHAEQHQAVLHDKLTLSPAQETAWLAFQSQIKASDPQDHAKHQGLDKLNTLQRLDQMEAWHQARAAQHTQRSQAIRLFYAQLTEAQQLIFDQYAFSHHRRYAE